MLESDVLECGSADLFINAIPSHPLLWSHDLFKTKSHDFLKQMLEFIQ